MREQSGRGGGRAPQAMMADCDKQLKSNNGIRLNMCVFKHKLYLRTKRRHITYGSTKDTNLCEHKTPKNGKTDATKHAIDLLSVSNTTDIQHSQHKSVPNRTQQPSDAGKQVNKLYTKLNITMNAKHTKT